MRYWLMKSEPSVFTIEDLEKSPQQTVKWIPTKGIRNYQARNFMRDDMSLGDLAFFYQSNCDTPGIVGIMKFLNLLTLILFNLLKGTNILTLNHRWINQDG